MGLYVRTELDLTDYNTLCNLATICGAADFSFKAEQLLSWIAQSGRGEAFGDYLRKEYNDKNSEFRTTFDKLGLFDIWEFFIWLDKNNGEIYSSLDSHQPTREAASGMWR